ncbi:hypothetical protein CNMCM8980_001384 [Aspergillus fumigatiaffinis]|uniref:Uncharacterized protein n=1 Tax=Aspergillus fumigatiaffinis TaxID=340414 RepID=A0A8H4MA37_9EURO|nr:hypothetical protein CNMCM5878_004201 [Aspergillus fumigatiaffinis]KAF4235313.1 hypothetical protein CNMCM6457_003114 [Aspergillus fumigatiaffinis]KAF4240245.1 hypothetical protein CNMCM8980_001384 [Aspergillus fumigatiaffinis]KAF4241176.1 hypothetical protein CNMCM6805_004336 [Aspergillus fumigatiaffinis]
MSTAVQGLNADMHAPIAASGSGGRRPDRGNGGRRPPDRGPGKVTKKTKKRKKCLACQKWGHTVEECRLYGAVLRNAALATARILATETRSSPQTSVLATGRSSRPLGPPQQHPRMNSRQRRTARRLAERQQQQAQEQLGRQEQAPQEQLPQQQSPQDQRPQRSAESRMRPAPREPPEGASWSDQIDLDE